mgnify:CR=1 FL=1
MVSPLTHISQGLLNLLEICPRKCQHIFLDQLGTPVSLEQQEHLSWGSRFHLLMQQRELGLPVESLIKEDTQLQHWVTALVQEASNILIPARQTFRESEHCRTLTFQDYLLTVIYDLLIEDENSAQIIDWKTYSQPQKRQQLAKDWQTRLYLYVLAETSDYLPEQLSMTYWFVKSQPRPQSVKFIYSAAQHQKTRQDLSVLLSQLTQWLQHYQDDHIPFPQVAASAGRCHNCTFALHCQRTAESLTNTSKDGLPNLGDIQEISL